MPARSDGNQPPSRVCLRPGTRIRDTYTVDRYLGSGRFADVYVVRHRYMGMQAMKVLVGEFDEEASQAALTESFILSRMTHPGIVRVFDANRLEESIGGYPYLTMEYVDGMTLLRLMDNAATGLRVQAAVGLGLQIAEAAGHAHKQQPAIVHRDIKPSNILLSGTPQEPKVRVADFGLARAVNRFTGFAEAAGTLVYTAPESLRGFETPASDVFSIGLVLYEMLTGVLPFRRTELAECTTERQLRQRLSELHSREFSPPSQFDSACGPEIDYVVARALDRDHERRLATGAELASLLNAAVLANGAAAPPWGSGSGAKAAAFAFQVLRDPEKRHTGLAWLEKARRDEPSLAARVDPFIQLLRAQAWSDGTPLEVQDDQRGG